MTKLKFNLKEDDNVEEFSFEEPNELEVRAPLELPIEDIEDDSIFIDETDPKLVKFVCSDELNELRDILVELPEDIHMLLLDNKVIVLAKVDENNETFLYCLGDEDDEFTLVSMPFKLDEILANNSIIQYTPANISDVHEKVMELFGRELEPDDEEFEEDSIEEFPEENTEDNIDIDIDNDIEEEDEDEEDKINS